MRHIALSIVLSLIGTLAFGFEIENRARFGAPDAPEKLRIISTADIAFFEPRIQSFLDAEPDTEIDYVVASSTELMRAIFEEGEPFDLAISSAMDLQTKLANDGRALTHESGATQSLPDWAVWKDLIFAFTEEPATIVLSNAAFEGLEIPRNRRDLINLLRQHPDRFRGRIGTYDVRRSGLGYLFATQDTRASDTYWRLTEVMGALEAQLYCCSSEMIDAVASGDLAIAYNVLGSYAENRDAAAGITTILPEDFTTVMLRTMLIPTNATNPELAGRFVDHTLEETFGPDAAFEGSYSGTATAGELSLNRIGLGPGLLVFLDQLTRQAFLSEWENAILQE